MKDSARARERLFRADRTCGNYADFLRSRSHAVNVEISRRQRSEGEDRNSSVVIVLEAAGESGSTRAQATVATVDMFP